MPDAAPLVFVGDAFIEYVYAPVPPLPVAVMEPVAEFVQLGEGTAFNETAAGCVIVKAVEVFSQPLLSFIVTVWLPIPTLLKVFDG